MDEQKRNRDPHLKSIAIRESDLARLTTLAKSTMRLGGRPLSRVDMVNVLINHYEATKPRTEGVVV